MCGVAGFSGSYDPELLTRFSHLLAHRGPDDAGIWMGEGVGLAHRRLSIIDLSRHGHQPMHFAGCRLVYNGEFYNYRSIRKELESRGHRFHGCSDSEVLLHGWVEWGDGILERINGIYAFAVWDGKSRTLLLARDPMGVKPLYYTETTSGFAFASELKALTALPDLDRSIDPQAVDACLGHLWLPSPSTMFRAVRKLEPGHLLAVRDGRIVSRRPPHAPPFIPTPGQQTEYPRRAAAERLSEQLDRAVRRQLVSDVPVGAFLSGGLDSSAVVALARRRLDRLPCFTITFRDRSMADEGFADDLPYARRVARHLGVTLHEVEVGAALIDGLEQMVWQLDEPQADPAPLQAALICRAAHEAGIKVLLSGTGGDDLFTGYRRHRALLLERWWRWWPAAIRRRLQRFAATLPHSSGTGRRIARAFRFAGVDEEERIVGYFRWLDPERQRCLYSPEFRDAVGTPAPLRDFLRTLPDGLTPLQRMLALEQRFFLADHNLNYTDKSGMAYGVEVRVPLLDLELVRFANRLPDRYKQRGATGKWLFKQAMEGVLPREVIHRPKTGFGAPVRRWLHHDLREMVGDLLSEEGIRRRGWFDPQAVRRMIADDAAGRIDAAYSIFAMLCMELWCRRFVDRRQERG